MPILCNYYVTYRCNAFCGFCHFGDHEAFRGSRHAAREDVLRNLSGLKALGVRFIDFTGGEPLLHPDLADFCAEGRRLGMTTSVTTNGLLYPKFAERLAGKVDLLHFSLDSADRAQHDGMRGVACFDAVVESIGTARRLGEHPDLLFTVTNENHTQLEPVYELARRHELLLLINPIFNYFNDLTLSDEALDFVERFARRPMTYMNPSFISLRRRGGNDPADPLCKAVSRVIVISPENEILLPCYHFHQDRIPIGNDVEAAWKLPLVEEHRRREGRHDFCRGCAINCYFEPSFAFPTNLMSIATVPSKLRYGYHKYVRRRIALMRRRA
jgi:MoaA/NifB/PqqE/SkfB family radical SAM enzyme